MPYQKPPIKCPACEETDNFTFIQDYKSCEGKFSLHECSKCKARFWAPLDAPFSKWYDKAYAEERILKNFQGLKVRCGVYKKSLKLNPGIEGVKILDLGCGMGEFMHELEKRGAEVWGADFSQKSVEFAKRNFNLKNIYSTSFEDFFKKTDLPLFDIIFFFEVIEHLDRPLEFIKNVKKFLKPNGKIILSTPCRERIMANIAKWDYPPHHLSRWNKESVANLFKKIGFEISGFYYVDQFDFIMGALTEKTRMGLVAKTAVALSKHPAAAKQSNLTKKIIIKIVHLGGYVKNYAIAGIPAVVLWVVGKILHHKNGRMLIELKTAGRNE